MNKSYYAIIPANVRYDRDLKPNAKLLYGEITALCNEKGYCWASNSYFAELYQVSNNTISRWISQLQKKGYINTRLNYKQGTKQIDSRYIQLSQGGYIQKSQYPIDKNVNTPIDKNVKDNNTVINNTINNTLLENSSLKNISKIDLKKNTSKSIFNQLKEIYHDWYINNPYYHGLKPDWTGAEFSALKALVLKLKKLGNPQQGADLNNHAINCFKYILRHFEQWGNDYHKSSGLRVLNSKFNDIIVNIKKATVEEKKKTSIPKPNNVSRIPRG